jgi:hypothetical protein
MEHMGMLIGQDGIEDDAQSLDSFSHGLDLGGYWPKKMKTLWKVSHFSHMFI